MAIRYSDIDLSFIPNPISKQKHKGRGKISFFNNSTTVTGSNTQFSRYLQPDFNLYVANTFIGKIKSIDSDTSITLYSNAKVSPSTDVYDTLTPSVIRNTSSDLQAEFTTDLQNYEFNVSSLNSSISEGQTIRFDILSNYDMFCEEQFRLTYRKGERVKIKYKVLGIDSYDVVGEYPRQNPYYPEISDTLEGYLYFYPVTTGNTNTESGFYRAYLQFQTSPDSEIEILERASLQFTFDNDIILSIHETEFEFSSPGDILIKTDDNCIKTAIRHLIKTRMFERPFNSDISSDFYNVLFENTSPIIRKITANSIVNVINNFEPRVENVSVSITNNLENPNSILVSVTYSIVNETVPQTLTITFERTR